MQSRNLTIVFTDIKGFTERTANADRGFVLKLMGKHDELLKPVIQRYQGQLIKTIGDAYLLTFESPTNAVLCALMMQETLKGYNKTAPTDEKIEIRIAINTGEVNVAGGDVLGEPVNVTSRLEGITEANEIWFTESTYLAMNKQEVPNSLVGEFRLKGVPEALKVYRVVLDETSELFKRTLAAQQVRLNEPVPPVTGGAQPAAVPGTLVLGLGLVGLALVVIFFLTRPNFGPALQGAEESLQARRFDEALARLDPVLKQDAEHTAAKELIRRTVEASCRDALERSDLAAARRLFDEMPKRYPFLGRMEPLETTLVLAECLDARKNGTSEEIYEKIDHLIKNHRDDPDTHFAVAKFFNQTGMNWQRSITHLYAALLAKPAVYAADPVVKEEIEYFLRHVGPDDGYDDFRTYIANHDFERLKPTLEQNLYNPATDARELRWNAQRILRMKNQPVDLSRFYQAELLDSPGSLPSGMVDEAVAFFLAVPGQATSPVVIPAVIDRFPLLNIDAFKPDSKLWQLVTGPFFAPLRELLVRCLADRTVYSSTRRANAFEILKAKDLSPAEELAFHLTNAASYDEMIGPNYSRAAWFASLEWLAKNGGTVADPSLQASGSVVLEFAAIRADIRKLFEDLTESLPKVIAKAKENKNEFSEELNTKILDLVQKVLPKL